MATGWADLARRAAMSLTRGSGASPETASVAFVAIDGSRGAVHATVEGGVPAGEAQRFAERFSEVCHGDGRPMRVVSVSRWVGEPLDVPGVPVTAGVALAVDVHEGDGSMVRRLHIARSIAAAQKLAEDSVLDVGHHMRGIFELARSHAGSLEGLVAQYSHANGGQDTIASTIEALGSRVDRVNEELVERVSRQAKSLERARGWTSDIVRLGQSIAAIASSARMLTFNARIESARIGEAGKGFAVIAQSIQDLATQIRETNDAVGSLASNLARALPELGSEAQAMASDAKDQLAQLTANLQKVRAQLEATRGEAHASLVASTENATQLEQRANGVLEKLQFQDRTHQMLEEARVQTEALLTLVGVDESAVDQTVVEQVGWLGKQLEGSAQLKAAGSVELF
jgi:methyl-accepting chemotaxis protein